jgi:hypothetical protein
MLPEMSAVRTGWARQLAEEATYAADDASGGYPQQRPFEELEECGYEFWRALEDERKVRILSLGKKGDDTGYSYRFARIPGDDPEAHDGADPSGDESDDDGPQLGEGD